MPDTRSKENKAGAVLLAAGLGKRLNAGTRKANVLIGGKPVFYWPLMSLHRSPLIGEIALVVHAKDLEARRAFISRQKLSKRVHVVCGGPERQDSVGLGLAALDPAWPVLLVHDAARPFLDQDLIRRCVAAALKGKAALTVIPVTDSIKLVSGNRLKALPRERLLAAQTPQAAEAGILRRAHAWARGRGIHHTDEAALLEARGHECVPVAGYHQNFKITTPEDLLSARRLIKTFHFGR